MRDCGLRRCPLAAGDCAACAASDLWFDAHGNQLNGSTILISDELDGGEGWAAVDEHVPEGYFPEEHFPEDNAGVLG